MTINKKKSGKNKKSERSHISEAYEKDEEDFLSDFMN
jgi:hypothetical protein